MGEVVYILCAVTSLACAVMLLRGYRRSGAKLLLWSCVCFFGLCLNNVVLFADMVLLPDWNLLLLRSGTALVSLLVLVYGLVWSSE